MRQIKFLNALLWIFNVLLGAGIVAFAFQFILFQKVENYFEELEKQPAEPEEEAPVAVQRNNFEVCKISNPMHAPEEAKVEVKPTTPIEQIATLVGTLTNETQPTEVGAFLKMKNAKEARAWYGEPIMFTEGESVSELAGWKLVSVTARSATFTNGSQKATLTIAEPTIGLSGPMGGPFDSTQARPIEEGPYDPSQFTSRKLQADQNREVWGIDEREVEWAAENVDEILNSQVSVSPHPTGGVRVDSVASGSVVEARGIRPGDLIRSVNGIAVSSMEDARNLMNSPQFQSSTNMVLTIERAGRIVTIDYRQLR